MSTPQEILRRYGIQYVATKKSEYTTTCPRCNDGGYLNVKINHEGVAWYCHHCKEGGGEKFDKRSSNGNGADTSLGLIKAVFDYVDEDGKRLFQVLRFEPVGQPKTFRQRTGPDQKKWSVDGVRIVPFRLPELMNDLALWSTIFIVEGEKDVNTLRSHSIPATTNPMGAGKWRNEWGAEFFKGADVVICGDNDQPGREHAVTVARALKPHAERVRLLDLKTIWPEIKPSDDISDWFKAGGNTEQLWAAVEDLPIWKDEQVNGATHSDDHAARSDGEGNAGDFDGEFTADELSHMEFEPIRYIIPGFIAEGLTLFAGKPKIGKSWLLMHAAWSVACGDYTLGGIKCEEGDVLYAALEDNRRRLKSRMRKLFGRVAWPKRLTFKCAMPRLAEGGIEYIRGWLKKAKQPRLVVIDTLAMVRMPNRKDQTSYDADYAAMKDLRTLAADFGVAIIVVHHLRKAEAEDPFDTISGTLGLTGAPDTVMILYRDAGGIVLEARGRDIEEIKKAVQFDRGTCLWTITGNADEVRVSVERTTIAKALDEAGKEPLTPQQIAAETGMKAGNVKMLLRRMLKDGAVKKASYGKYVRTTPDRPPRAEIGL
jgi:RecA-family ATPase